MCDRSPRRAIAISRYLEHESGLEVAASFGSVAQMRALIDEQTAPDLIALDLETAGSDAASTVEELMRDLSVPVLVLGGEADEGDERMVRALAAGAVGAIAGDRLRLDQPESVWATAIRSRVRRLSSVRLKRPAAGGASHGRPAQLPWRPGAGYRAVGIGTSVGGPPALATVLGGLPADYPLPVLVVQHMPPGFAAGLATWLDHSVALPVGLAVDGAALEPGVWMAPDGAHLGLEATMRLGLDRETKRGAHQPSLDLLFESLASSAGDEAVGVVLTGMGRDGTEGVRAIREAGGLTIAQDEQTSAVFGMPAAAIASGVDLVLPLGDMADMLATLPARTRPR